MKLLLCIGGTMGLMLLIMHPMLTLLSGMLLPIVWAPGMRTSGHRQHRQERVDSNVAAAGVPPAPASRELL